MFTYDFTSIHKNTNNCLHFYNHKIFKLYHLIMKYVLRIRIYMFLFHIFTYIFLYLNKLIYFIYFFSYYIVNKIILLKKGGVADIILSFYLNYLISKSIKNKMFMYLKKLYSRD